MGRHLFPLPLLYIEKGLEPMKVSRLVRRMLLGKHRPRYGYNPYPNQFPELNVPRVSRVSNPFTKLNFRIDDAQGFFLILNWLGYILLFASLVDYFLILYPPQLTNPNWELQTFSRMVDHAWILLLSLILIFLPTRTRIRRFEVGFLRLLRWTVFLGGVLFILLIPLGLINTQRIDQQTNEQLGLQQQARQEQLNELGEAIRTQNIPLEQLQQLGSAIGIEESGNREAIKESILTQIDQEKEQLREQVATAKAERFQQLIRRMVRTNLGALLIGTFLIRLWWETRWLKSLTRSAPISKEANPPQEGSTES